MSFLESLASSGAWYSGFIADFIKCFITKDRYLLILEGIGVTVKVSLLAILLGILIGLIVAMLNLSKTKILRAIGKCYTDVIRGTPAVTQLLIIYFVIFLVVLDLFYSSLLIIVHYYYKRVNRNSFKYTSQNMCVN